MGIQADIMEYALNDVLKSKDNWCVHAHARDENGQPVGVGSDRAKSHCGEGAIMAGAYKYYHRIMAMGFRSTSDFIEGMFVDIAKILFEQHPEFIDVVGSDCGEIPVFNDGARTVNTVYSEDGTFEHIVSVEIPSVGYEGIRNAFEKYLTLCQEKDL